MSSHADLISPGNADCRIAVLMATYNGMKHLQAQVDSVLQQSQVDVVLFCSDDGSSDGTIEALQELSRLHNNVRLLPKTAGQAGAGGNFYRLVRDLDFTDFDYVAFADQDDIWNLDKLHRHVQIIRKTGAGAVSSNVLAFWPDGQEHLLDKSQPQRKYDYLFESAGPGCTFLMSKELVSRLQSVLNNPDFQAGQVTLHDWLSYAVARSMGLKWVIDAKPSIRYRQHGNNVVGANVSLKAKLARLKKMRNGWYREQVFLVTRIAYAQSQSETVQRLLILLEQRGWGRSMKLLPYIWQGRRSVRERFYLMLVIIFNWF